MFKNHSIGDTMPEASQSRLSGLYVESIKSCVEGSAELATSATGRSKSVPFSVTQRVNSTGTLTPVSSEARLTELSGSSLLEQALHTGP